MINSLKRFCPVIAVILALLLLVSCSESAATESGFGESTESKASETEAETELQPELPDIKFDDSDFTIMHYESDTANSLKNKDLFAEATNGEPLNDAVYSRNSYVEDKYGVKIKIIWENWSSLPSKMKNLVMSGDNSVDVYYPFGYTVSQIFTEKLYYNFNDVPYIDFDKPWWDSNCVRDLTINGKTYFAVSNINILDKTATSILIFNKQLAVDYNLPDLYQLVLDNKWTIDTLTETAKGVTRDVNGDSVMDINDIYGLVGADTFTVALFHALGGNFTVTGEDGMPVSDISSAKNIDIFDKIFNLMYDSNIYQHIDWLGYPLAPEAVEEFFTGNHSLFSWCIIESLDRLRATDVDFGILPLPKYDESQKEYYHFVSKYAMSFMCLPVCADNIERTGVIIEALAAKSQYTVIPAYYDTILKGKYTRDNESEKMLDIIFASRIYSFADIAGIGTVSDFVLRCVSGSPKKIPDMSSSLAKQEKSFDKALEKFIENMSK